jgi:peptidoglycan lytic transglycosylase G
MDQGQLLQQPERQRGSGRIVAIGVVALLLAAGAAAVWVWYGVERPYQGFGAEGVFVDIPHGASSRSVARLLKQNGVVRSSFGFELYARRHPRRRLQAGEYFFNHPLSAHDVFWQIADGHVYEQPFTVREGETIFDIAHDIETEKLMSSDEFLAAAQNPELIRDIAPRAKSLEGFLFPATYFLPRHPNAAEVTAEMVHKFREEWQRVALAESRNDTSGLEHGRPVAAVVTLASLVERETPKPEERPLVAGAFDNRLKKGIPLQCDPTVIYALQDAGKYRGTLTGSDLHFESPYNTYAHAGLPPGPIGNPGEASLRAALEPAKTDYLYFVANTQGGHFFAATLAEHNRNVTRYRRLLAGLPADPSAEETAAAATPKPTPAAPKRSAKPRAKHTSATMASRKTVTKSSAKQKRKKHTKPQKAAEQ